MSIETYTEEHRILNPARTPELPEPMTGEELYEHLAAKIDELNGPKGQIPRTHLGKAALLGTIPKDGLTAVRIPMTETAETFVIGLGSSYSPRTDALIIPRQPESTPAEQRPLTKISTQPVTTGFDPDKEYGEVILGISYVPLNGDPNKSRLNVGHRSLLVPGITAVWAHALGLIKKN